MPWGWFSSVGTRMGAINSQWAVLRIGGVDFLQCWVSDSIQLEHAESLIIK